jgi:glycosyltransferase involved in cell wall biosynthesis
VHSKIALDELKKYYNIPVNKAVIIPHGTYVPGENKPPALPEVGNSTRYILSAGFIRESKGLDYLIEAFAGIGERHNVYLVIAGTVQEPGSNKDMGTYKNEMKYFQALKESTRQNNKIIWIDRFLSLAELNWLLLHAEEVVFSYTDCSQSGMFHRALGYNKPIVATSVGNFAEVINHGVNGLLVSPKNSPELHNAIDMLLSDKELGKKISASLKEEKIPTIKEISLRYRQLYQQIMGE